MPSGGLLLGYRAVSFLRLYLSLPLRLVFLCPARRRVVNKRRRNAGSASEKDRAARLWPGTLQRSPPPARPRSATFRARRSGHTRCPSRRRAVARPYLRANAATFRLSSCPEGAARCFGEAVYKSKALYERSAWRSDRPARKSTRESNGRAVATIGHAKIFDALTMKHRKLGSVHPPYVLITLLPLRGTFFFFSHVPAGGLVGRCAEPTQRTNVGGGAGGDGSPELLAARV